VDQDYRALLREFAFPHRAGPAYRTMLSAGPAALPAVRAGLRHPSGEVRLRCCQFFDQHLVPEVMDDLLALLDDPDERVRCMTLHVLSCDRCKQGSCRPEEAQVVPRAMALLEKDPDAHVRAHAAGLLGGWVHSNPGAAAAIARAYRADPSPAVRKKAGMLVPGGVLFRKSMPRPPRTERRRATS
jgi:HEAT repeat protein